MSNNVKQRIFEYDGNDLMTLALDHVRATRELEEYSLRSYYAANTGIVRVIATRNDEPQLAGKEIEVIQEAPLRRAR